MNAKIRKWGNSLGLRIPRAFAAELGMREGGEVDLAVREGRLVVRPRKRPTYRLADLIVRITRGNRHAGIEDGGPTGREML